MARMHMRALSLGLLGATVAIVALPGSEVAAQPDEGLLEIRVGTVLARPGGYTSTSAFAPSLTPAGVLESCEILIFESLERVKLPRGTAPLDLNALTPIKRSPVTQDGRLFVYVPPGEYSVIIRDCIPVLGGFTTFYPRPPAQQLTCCPNIDADPPRHELKTEDGSWVSNFQTVTVRSGGTTILSIFGRPEEPPSRAKVWMYLGIAAGIVVLGAIVVSIGVLRPTYNPRSSADKARSLPPPDPGERPADFDDVFGEFLRRRRE
jgi:hypothetical protein